MNIAARDSYDSLGGGGNQAELTVGTSAVEAKVGASAFDGRKAIMLFAKDSGLYYGFTSGVTTTTGISIFKDQIVIMPINENMAVWLIADSSGKKINVAEIAERG